jgi:glycosyltransferase involved in cell wall biosynthesis
MVPLGRARKLAFEQTRGDFFAILDADDVWLPQKLERQMELFDADADVGMTYCDALYFDDGGDRNRLFKLTVPHRGRVFGRLLSRNFIFSSTMMFRRAALDTVGGAFDDRFARAQDYDLTLRFAYHYPIDFVDEPLLKWRINGPADKPWKKSLVAREEEVKSSVETLIDAYPDIKTRYGVELGSLYKNIDYAFGVNAWRDGKRAEARRYLSRHLRSKKFAFVYFCTFLISFDFFYKVRVAYRDLTSSP